MVLAVCIPSRLSACSLCPFWWNRWSEHGPYYGLRSALNRIRNQNTFQSPKKDSSSFAFCVICIWSDSQGNLLSSLFELPKSASQIIGVSECLSIRWCFEFRDPYFGSKHCHSGQVAFSGLVLRLSTRLSRAREHTHEPRSLNPVCRRLFSRPHTVEPVKKNTPLE